MTTNRESADRRVIFAAITTTGIIDVRDLSAMTDTWYASWALRRPRRLQTAARRESELEDFITGKIATLRAVSAGRLLNRPSRVA